MWKREEEEQRERGGQNGLTATGRDGWTGKKTRNKTKRRGVSSEPVKIYCLCCDRSESYVSSKAALIYP